MMMDTKAEDPHDTLSMPQGWPTDGRAVVTGSGVGPVIFMTLRVGVLPGPVAPFGQIVQT